MTLRVHRKGIGGRYAVAHRAIPATKDKPERHGPFRTSRNWLKTCNYSDGCRYNKEFERCEPKKGVCRAVHVAGGDLKNCPLCQKAAGGKKKGKK